MRRSNTHSTVIPILLFGGGVAALSWELLWQHHASLALGVSAEGTAITLAATMGGMSLGAIVAGRILQKGLSYHPLYLYAVLEGAIGACGVLLRFCFDVVSKIDSSIYQSNPGAAPIVHLGGILLVLGIPAAAMGATLPVIGLISKEYKLSLARLYAFNTAGAAVGTCLLAFVLMPWFGVAATISLVAMINFAVASATALLAGRKVRSKKVTAKSDKAETKQLPVTFAVACGVVFVTGFATFTLEVAWFRAIIATFFSTTDVFALILFAVLISLAVGARLANYLMRTKISLPIVLVAASCLTLIATPFIEQLDVLAIHPANYWMRIGSWLLLSLLTMGPSIICLGVALPWILDTTESPTQWGTLYALNTVGAILGATLTAWVLLPTIGFNRAAWLAATMVGVVGIINLRRSRLVYAVVVNVACLCVAIGFDSGAGRYRAYGMGANQDSYDLIDIQEGPDVTTAVIETPERGRQLLIDGFVASSESPTTEYMEWMGRLPMLMHPDPQNALVIAFGTGRTAHSVRDENPMRLDVVDINPVVFEMARHFPTNHQVLEDPKVNHVVMDGRAYLRRTKVQYDVVTLEPMPPHFAGVNSLYSQDFYEIMSRRLNEGAVVAQWLPIHIVTPEHSLAIGAAFQAVFKESVMWRGPDSGTIILIGRWGKPTGKFGTQWPGFKKHSTKRSLPEADIRRSVLLGVDGFEQYAGFGVPVTDDNQTLAYGEARINRYAFSSGKQIIDLNLKTILNFRRP